MQSADTGDAHLNGLTNGGHGGGTNASDPSSSSGPDPSAVPTKSPAEQPIKYSDQQPALKSPTAPSSDDKEQNVAVDFMKNKYETGKTGAQTIALPSVFREPKKLDITWDKDANEKKEGLAGALREFDLLSCLNVQVNESKAQFEGLKSFGSTNSDGSTSPVPVNRQVVEKVAPPEITKNVRAMFESGQMAERHQVKKTVVPKLDISEVDAGVFESTPEPLKIEGLVRSADQFEVMEVQKGTTKSLLSQWNKKGNEEFRSEKKMINIVEGDGKILESTPVKRSDVVSSEAASTPEVREVKQGATKNLLSQWQTKGSEEFRSDKKVINLQEAEGKVLESTPIKRTDVVRSDEYVAEGTEVQKGTTRNLLDQWKTKGSEEFKTERRPINLTEAEGKVLENEPVRRTDVVNSDCSLVSDGPGVEKGTTKNLLNQWKTKGQEEFKTDRKPIIIAEVEGQVVENEPEKRLDVVNSQTSITDGTEVQKGTTKNLLNQWKVKGTEEFKVEKKLINLMEAQGQIVENEPVRRTDVVNANNSDAPDGTEVEKGMTKNLLNQWKVKGTEEFKVDRKPITISEDQGQITENEPVKRTDVVNSNSTVASEGSEVERGTTKNLLNQWKIKGTEEFKSERKPIVISEDQGQVIENEPTKRTDVVNANSEVVPEGSEVQKGTTKSLLSQWKQKGTEEFKSERKSIIIVEDDGKVVENEPEPPRSDVVRQDDVDPTAGLPSKGQARLIKEQWVNRKEEQKEQKVIRLVEGENNEPTVVENQPVVRTDVVRAEDNAEEEICLQKGYTRNLAGFWTAPPKDFKAPRDQPIDIHEGADISAPAVYENTPQRLEGVIRAEDALTEEEVALERGRAKNMVSMFQNRRDEHVKQPFQIETELNAATGGVYENEPDAPSEGVVKNSDYVDEVVCQRGMIKNIMGRFKDDGSDNSLDKKPKDMIVIEKAPCAGVYENEPEVRVDVFREDPYAAEVISVQSARNMRALWCKKENQEETRPVGTPDIVRFTPPREMSPPPTKDDFKSIQNITLTNSPEQPISNGGPTHSPSSLSPSGHSPVSPH